MWWREYQYAQARPGLSHGQYLDEPDLTVEAMTRIHAIVLKSQNEQGGG